MHLQVAKRPYIADATLQAAGVGIGTLIIGLHQEKRQNESKHHWQRRSASQYHTALQRKNAYSGLDTLILVVLSLRYSSAQQVLTGSFRQAVPQSNLEPLVTPTEEKPMYPLAELPVYNSFPHRCEAAEGRLGL